MNVSQTHHRPNWKNTLMVLGTILVALALMGASSCQDLANSGDASDSAKAHWDEITFGMSESQVVSILGEPTDRQEQNINMGELGGGTQTSVCIYYGVGTYQLCFDNDSLTSKNKY